MDNNQRKVIIEGNYDITRLIGPITITPGGRGLEDIIRLSANMALMRTITVTIILCSIGMSDF